MKWFKFIHIPSQYTDIIQSASLTLDDLKTEIGAETVGFIDASDTSIIGIDIIRSSIISINEEQPAEDLP